MGRGRRYDSSRGKFARRSNDKSGDRRLRKGASLWRLECGKIVSCRENRHALNFSLHQGRDTRRLRRVVKRGRRLFVAKRQAQRPIILAALAAPRLCANFTCFFHFQSAIRRRPNARK